MKIYNSVGRRGRNRKEDVATVQQLINRAIRQPFRLLVVDSMVGPITIKAIENFQSQVLGFKQPDGLVEPNGKTWKQLERYLLEIPRKNGERFMVHDNPQNKGATKSDQPSKKPPLATSPLNAKQAIAWGKMVSKPFKLKVKAVASNIGIPADYLMACMAFETGETFSPSIKNAAGSGATGLIQFMPSTARSLGTSVEKLSKMTAEQQLDYVEKYFKPYKGRLKTLEDVYMAILYPAAIGKSPLHELFKKGTMTYEQNSGFDKNKDGVITPAEISIKVRQKYEKGLSQAHFG